MEMKFQPPLDRTFNMFPLFELKAPPHSLEPFELNHALNQVERILETEPIAVDQMVLNINPDPLYPQGRGTQVVDKISFTDTYKDQGESFVDLLSPLLHQKNKRNLADSYEPIAVSYSEQMGQHLNDVVPPNSKKFKTRPEFIVTPLTVKSHQSEGLHGLDMEETLRKKVSPADGDCDDEVRFRSYQSGQWTERYQDLCVYRQEHDHCVLDWKSHPLLAQWVKRQRYQYKLRSEGKHTTLTDERLMALASLGFIWDSHQAIWEERFNELYAFHRLHGHANVPTKYPENPQLAIWVKGQRRHYSLYQSGKKTSISQGRTSKLNRLGFTWNVRARKAKAH
jgi:hypothetical protein